jgi:hypothetical protein
MALGSTLVRRGKPAWEWVPVWVEGKEFAGCDCPAGPPENRCDWKWLRCNGRLGEERRRVEAILAYRDPDARHRRAPPKPSEPPPFRIDPNGYGAEIVGAGATAELPPLTGPEFVAGIHATAPEAFSNLDDVLEPSDVHEDRVPIPNFAGGYPDVHIPKSLITQTGGYVPGKRLQADVLEREAKRRRIRDSVVEGALAWHKGAESADEVELRVKLHGSCFALEDFEKAGGS